MKASAHMVRLDAPDSVAVRGSRGAVGARPSNRSGARLSLQTSSSQQAARSTNGASVPGAANSIAAGSAAGDNPKTPQDSSKQASFDAIFRELDAQESDSNANGSQPDAKDSDQKKDDSASSNVLTAPVAVAAPLKEILPLIFALPHPVISNAVSSAAAVAPASNSATINNTLTAEVGQAASPNDSEGSAANSSDAQPKAANIQAPPPLPESMPIVPRGEVAFTAKLTPSAQDNAQKSEGPASTHAAQTAIPAAPKAAFAAALIETAAIEKIAEPIVRTAPFTAEVATQAHAGATPKMDAALPLNAAAAISRLAEAIELPPAPPNSANEIIVRIPDATERGTDVRFVERAGEINVTVRTTDTEMAQSLRSGLTDLSARLEQSGIRAEMWKPGSDNSSSGDESARRWNEQKNSQREAQETADGQKNGKRPRWMEALELSLGRTN